MSNSSERDQDAGTLHKTTAVETRTFYCGYMLSCEPMPLDDGRFEARVVVTSLSEDKTRSQRFLDLETFASKEAAIERARCVGMEWIDANARRA